MGTFHGFRTEIDEGSNRNNQDSSQPPFSQKDQLPRCLTMSSSIGSQEARDSFTKVPALEDGSSTPTEVAQSAVMPSGETPKGHFFPSLDEAHRNITSRMGSHSTSRNASSGNNTISSEDIPLQDMRATTSSCRTNMLISDSLDLPVAHVTQRSLTHPKTRRLDFSASQPVDRQACRPPGSSVSINSDVNTYYHSFHNDHGLPDIKGPRQASDSTVERILNQYIPSSELDSSSSSFPFHNKKRVRSESPYSISLGVIPSSERPKDDGFSTRLNSKMPSHKDKVAFRFDLSDTREDTPTKLGRLPLRNNLTSPTPDDQDAIGGPHMEADTLFTPNHPEIVATTSLPKLPAPRPAYIPTIFGSKSAGAKASANAMNLRGARVPQSGESLNVTVEEQVEGEIRHFTADRVGSGIGSLLPPPHRMHSNRSRRMNQSSFISGTGKSTGNLTTDSDDDPFRYDRQSFGVFLQPSKEREVSAALRHVSGLSVHSMGTIYSPDGTPLKTISRARMFDNSPQSVNQIDVATRRPGSGNKLAESFYNTSAIQSKWAIGADSDQVKVAVQRVAP